MPVIAVPFGIPVPASLTKVPFPAPPVGIKSTLKVFPPPPAEAVVTETPPAGVASVL